MKTISFEFDAIETFRYSGDFEVTVMGCWRTEEGVQTDRLPFILTVRELLTGDVSGELTFAYNGETLIHWIDSETEDGFFETAHKLVRAYVEDGHVWIAE